MLYEIMRYIKNFFPVSIHEGFYKIERNTIGLPFLQAGQYFAIQNSILNDGVYCYPAYDLTDESGTFTIAALRPPKEFLELVAEIEEWQKKKTSNDTATGPFASESFENYSYTKATNKDGELATWKDVFKGRLSVWRKR